MRSIAAHGEPGFIEIGSLAKQNFVKRLLAFVAVLFLRLRPVCERLPRCS